MTQPPANSTKKEIDEFKPEYKPNIPTEEEVVKGVMDSETEEE